MPAIELLSQGLLHELQESMYMPRLALDAEAEAYFLHRIPALLEELRTLARAHPDNATVRAHLAEGLFKVQQTFQRQEVLLDELHTLARAHPDDVWAKHFIDLKQN